MMPITYMNQIIPLPEHGNNKVDQQEIREQHKYTCNKWYSPVLLWTSIHRHVRLQNRGHIAV